MSEERAIGLLDAALRRRVRPPDTSTEALLRAGMRAVYGGLVTEDWATVADGFVLLCDIWRTNFGEGFPFDEVEPS